MQMPDGLHTVLAAVAHEPVPVFEIEERRDRLDLYKQTTEQSGVAVFRSIERSYVPLRYDQHMDGRLRLKIVKAQYIIVLIRGIRGYIPVRYFAKDTFGHIFISFLK
jgi:hypothetical protein